MTRINTNVSSLVAQNALVNSQTQLQQALTRLSTGLRINSGADDPAGLIASQVLQSNITSTNQAITNSQQANELIATADSALSQVGSLLTSIRGLVSAAANTGALTPAQIAANQLQVDSSLSAIDRISQSTTFGGQSLLNGSLNFITTSAGTINAKAAGTIGSQVNVEATGSLGGTAAAAATATLTTSGTGTVTFTATATGAADNGITIQLTNGNSGGAAASASYDSSTKTLTITANSAATAASVVAAVAANASATAVVSASVGTAGTAFDVSGDTSSATTAGGASALANTITLSASTAGTAYNNVNVTIANNAATGAETAAYSTASNTLTVHSNASSTVAQINAAINATGVFSASTSTDGTGTVAAGTTSAVTSGGLYNNEINIQAKTGGAAYNNASVVINQNAATGHETASYNAGTNTLTVHSNVNSTSSQLATAINTDGTFSASAAGAGLGTISSGTLTDVTTGGATGSAAISNLQISQADFGTASSLGVQVNINQQATQAQLVYSGGALASNTILQIGGDQGFQVLNLGAGTTLAQVETAVNQVSDSTGVTATVSGSQLQLNSTDYGSSGFVSVNALSGSFSTHLADHTAATRTNGTDVQATINGEQATGNGLTATLSSSTLNLSFNVNAAAQTGDTYNFSITGGGANFQLGPDVVSSEQARIGIPSVSTTSLGGTDGTLYELRTGGALSLSNNTVGAASVVNQAITQVATLQGQLGAFQSTTLQTNISTLTNTVANLTAAQSNIQDADFAAETANLTRAQILVQSGTSVLQIANQQPQQVLALLQHG